MEGNSKTLAITLCGLLTSLATAGILALIEVQGNFAFYSLMGWYILPIGAIASGFVAALGYFAAAKWTNYRPDWVLRINIVIVSGLTYFALQYLIYANVRVEGTPLSSVVGFPRFLQYTITNQTYTEDHSPTHSAVELGDWGYGITALQIAGFSLGGLIVYGLLLSQPYCEPCSRYLINKGTQKRESRDGEAVAAKAEQMVQLMHDDKLQEAIREHSFLPEQKLGGKATHKTSLNLRHCPRCELHQLRFVVSVRSRNGWDVGLIDVAAAPHTLAF